MKTSLNHMVHPEPPLKIAVIGAGAVGSFYGAKLAKAGHKVIFYSRSYKNNYGRLLNVKSIWGNFSQDCHFINTLKRAVPCDLILVAVKARPEIDYKKLITPFMKRPGQGKADSQQGRTVIGIMQNGINQEEKVAKLFKRSVVCGMLAFTCINRISPMKISHLDYGLIKIAPLVKFEYKIAEFLQKIFLQAGIHTSILKNLRAARWEKLLWNIPYNSLSVVLGGVNTREIMNDIFALNLVNSLMAETRMIAKADGILMGMRIQKEMQERTKKMNPYKTSMLLDYESGKPLESDLILGEPIQIAHKNGILVPNMEMIYSMLKFREHHVS